MLRITALMVVLFSVGIAFLRSGVNAAPPGGGLLVVANQYEHTVLIVDPESRHELAKIVVGVNGHELIVSKGALRTFPSTGTREWESRGRTATPSM